MLITMPLKIIRSRAHAIDESQLKRS